MKIQLLCNSAKFAAHKTQYTLYSASQEKQTDFVNALTEDDQETLLRLVIIWRRDTSHIKYEWVSGVSMHLKHLENESLEHSFNATKTKLDSNIQRLLRSSEALSNEAEVKVFLLVFVVVQNTRNIW